MAINISLLNSGNTNNINTNFERVASALQEAISRDGAIPNQMNSDFDMNSHDLLNGGDASFNRIVLDGIEMLPYGAQGWSPVFSALEADGKVVMRLVDYVGGQGAKPSEFLNFYVGPTGYVPDTASATNFGGASGVTDGDRGDIVVSGAGSVWTVEDLDTSQLSYLAAATGAQARPGNSKLFDWISVKDFGATGDGTTDDRAAINAAISSMNATGGVVMFPTGRYKIIGAANPDGLKTGVLVPFNGNYPIDRRIQLIAAGKATLLAGVDDMVVLRVSRPGTVVDGLEIDGGRNYGAGFTGTWGIGLIPEDRTATGPSIVSQSFCRVSNCHITQTYEGLMLEPGPTITGVGSGAYYPVINNNHFNWNSRAICIKTSNTTPGNEARPTRGVIENNRIERGVCGIDLDYATEFMLKANYFQFMWATFESAYTHPRQFAVPCAIHVGTHSANNIVLGGEAEDCDVDVQNDAAILGAGTAITFNSVLTNTSSGTLNANWAGTTGSYLITFSSGDDRIVTLTNGSPGVSWYGNVTASASATAYARSVRPYGITYRDFTLGGIFAGISTNFNPAQDARLLRFSRRYDFYEQIQVVAHHSGFARWVIDTAGNGTRNMAWETNGSERMEISSSGQWTFKGSAGNINMLTTGSAIQGTHANGITLSTTGTAASLSAGGKSVQINAAAFQPGSDNNTTSGTASFRWSTVYAGSATINTSDARLKDWRGGFNDHELRVAKKLSKLIGIYRWKDMVEQKGEDARLHAGVLVQDVMNIFKDEGLDPFDYGMVCYDEWQDEYESIFEEKLVQPEGEGAEPELRMVDTGRTRIKTKAGNRYGLRYDELWAFIIAGQEARLEALENGR